MVILGIDPGLQTTGCVVVEQTGGLCVQHTEEIKTKSGDLLALRLQSIFERVCLILDRFKPEVVVLEKLYAHYKHPITAVLLGHARGVVVLAAATRQIKIVEFPATHVKKAITGMGLASKAQVQKMVGYLYRFKTPLRSEHLSDALGLAITFLHTQRLS